MKLYVNLASCSDFFFLKLAIQNNKVSIRVDIGFQTCLPKWDIRDAGSIPQTGRYPGGGHGNPLQYSCWENPMDRGDWRATVHGVTKSQTLSMHACS